MKLPHNRLRLHSGKVVRFKTAAKRATFERMANASKHGWHPTGGRAKHR